MTSSVPILVFYVDDCTMENVIYGSYNYHYRNISNRCSFDVVSFGVQDFADGYPASAVVNCDDSSIVNGSHAGNSPVRFGWFSSSFYRDKYVHLSYRGTSELTVSNFLRFVIFNVYACRV